MTSLSRFATAVLVILVVLSVTPTVAFGLPDGQSSGSIAESSNGHDTFLQHDSLADSVHATTQTANETNNTVQHRDPDEVGEDGDQEAIANWLTRSMANRLGESAIELSQGEYELAQSVLGDGYNDDLARYIDVAGETSATQDTANTFNETQQTQRTYTEQVRSHREIYEEYQEAVEDGDTERARELARELIRLETQINETDTELLKNYAALENRTDESFDPAEAAILNVSRNVTELTEEAIDQTLVETILRIDSVSERASFEDPLVVEGQILGADGSAVSEGAVILSLPGEDTRVRTDENGTFSLRHRPVALQPGAQTLDLEYRPGNTSVYLPATATVTTEIIPVEASLSVLEMPESVGFDDPVAVDARLTVDGQPVEGGQVTVSIGDLPLGETTTNRNGTAMVIPPLPAAVPTGDQTVTVQVPWEGRAIQAQSVERTIEVESTATNLTMQVENGTDVRVGGSLESIDGVAVGDEVVTLATDEATITTVRTNADGEFTTTLGAAEIPENESVTITARYDGEGSNLEGDQATATVRLQPADSDSSTSENADGSSAGEDEEGSSAIDRASEAVQEGTNTVQEAAEDNPLVLVGGALLTFGILVGIVMWYRRRSAAEPTISDDSMTSKTTNKNEENNIENPLRSVEQRLEEGDRDNAAITLYETILTTLPINRHPELTHWERYHNAKASLPTDQVDLLERATELYEHAQFAPTTVSTDSVAELLDTVQETVEREDKTARADD